MLYTITVKSREGVVTDTHDDTSRARALTYFRIRYALPHIPEHTIAHCLTQTQSFSCSHNGGLATIRVEAP